MSEKTRPAARSICYVVGLASIAAANAAHAAECFPGPDFKPVPGSGWHYQIDSATNQGCWYIKVLGSSSRRRTGELARSSRSGPTASSSESAATSRAPRSDSGEGAPAAASQSFIKEWFSSTFTGLPNSSNAYSNTETGNMATTGPSVIPKRSNESSASRQRQRSKSEQQTNVAQLKSEREQSGFAARPQHAIHAASILEAAGDKPVLSPPTLWGEELLKAIEAVGDKDIVIAPAERQEDWHKALYEEFLQWRLRQLIPQ